MRSLQERAERFGGANTVRNVLIVAIAYYLGAEIAFLIGTLSDRIFAPFWPPNIVLFCALLITPPRQWWIYIAAALPAHILAELRVGMPVSQFIVAFATNCLVAIANAFAVQRLMVEPPWFGTIRKTIIYVLITAFLSPAFCALGGAFVQILGGGSLEDYGLFWARWYASNALGSLTLGPIAMICIESTTRPRLAPAGRAVEAAIVAALLIAACVVAFEDLPSIATGYLPLLLYLPLPIIVWAAVRFGAKGASGAVFVISVALIWRTLNGPSLFDIGSPETNVFGMHLDLGASQFLTKQLQVGLVGYWYNQLSCDSGAGDRVGCFESRVAGIGPQIGYIIPISNEYQGYINLKGYREFAAEHRADGWNVWLTFAISPAAKQPPAAKPIITK